MTNELMQSALNECTGSTENGEQMPRPKNARLENVGLENAGLENAGVENEGPNVKARKCRRYY